MIYIEKVKFKARPYAPKPEECTYWIDLTADPDGKVWRVWNGEDWELMSMGSGSGGSIDAYTKTESDRKFATIASLQEVSDKVDTKQDTLVSNVNIKTINRQSILGSGDIEIAVGLDQDAVETLIEQRLDELVDGAPAAVDTLKELANAINNDPSFATTITNLLSQKVDTTTYNSEKANFATKTEIADFITETDADSKYALKSEVGPGEEVDLSGYLTIESASTTYATKSELTSGLAVKLEEDDLDDYVTTDSLTSQLANKLDITTAQSTYATKSEIAGKQDALISGETIKTVNGQSIMGAGNILIEAPEGGLTDAPADGNYYGRKDNVWSQITIPDTSNLATKEELASKANTSDLSNYLTTANAESTYATKTALESKLDTSTYTTDKATFALKSEIPTDYLTDEDLPDTSNLATKAEVQAKQDTLVSGTNIKTINSQSLLGEGNIEITSGTGGITDAPSDSKIYGRNNGAWVEVTTPDLSSYASQTYVDSKVSELVNSAPEALNTLDELAAALGDDANFATTVTNSLASKAALSGAEFTGTIGAPIVALNRSSEGMMGAIQAESNDILFRTYNAGVDSMTFQVQSSTPLKITEAGIWENNQLLENKYAQLSDLDDLATTTQLNNKQDTLVSGTNIKTVNGESLLGEGDIDLGDYVTSDSLSTTLSGYVQTSAIADMETKTNAAATYQPKGDYATTSSLTSKLDTSTYNADKATFALKTELPDISTKQDTLVSGTNIKTINGESLLGSGDIVIESSQDPDLSDYVTNSSLTTTLEPYATKAEIPSVVLSGSYAASTATAPVANDTYEQAIAKLHAYINKLESISGILNREDVVQQSSLSNLPNNKNYILASVSSNQTLSFTTSGWSNNTSVHIFVYNSSSSEITITVPNTGGYVNMSSETLTIPGNTGAEIDAFKDEIGNIWVRHAAGELTINPDMGDQ